MKDHNIYLLRSEVPPWVCGLVVGFLFWAIESCTEGPAFEPPLTPFLLPNDGRSCLWIFSLHGRFFWLRRVCVVTRDACESGNMGTGRDGEETATLG